MTAATTKRKKTTRRPLKRAREIAERLGEAVPAPAVELDFDSGWQLLIATILAAQSTDKVINAVTPALFARWPDAAALAAAPLEEVEVAVKRTGFFRNKAKAIIGASAKLVTDFDGEVPRDIDALTTLPGVARKTANVVLGSAYGLPSGIVVDTHVSRVSQRLRLTRQTDPTKIEADLMRLMPPEQWIDWSHRVILHGRYVCKAKSPQCGSCPLNELCPGRQGQSDGGPWEARAEWEAATLDDARSV